MWYSGVTLRVRVLSVSLLIYWQRPDSLVVGASGICLEGPGFNS